MAFVRVKAWGKEHISDRRTNTKRTKCCWNSRTDSKHTPKPGWGLVESRRERAGLGHQKVLFSPTVHSNVHVCPVLSHGLCWKKDNPKCPLLSPSVVTWSCETHLQDNYRTVTFGWEKIKNYPLPLKKKKDFLVQKSRPKALFRLQSKCNTHFSKRVRLGINKLIKGTLRMH